MIVVVLAVVTGAVLARRWRGHRRRAARRDAARDLPRVAAELARSVRAGATLGGAVDGLVGPVPGILGPELAGVAGAVERGSSIDRALAHWQAASSVAGVDLLVGACRFGVGHGGDLARALDGVAATLLDTLEVEDEVRALVTQARTSAAVLVALPPLGAAMFALADPAVAQVLLRSTVGWVCVAVGASLDAAGAWVAARLIRGATS